MSNYQIKIQQDIDEDLRMKRLQGIFLVLIMLVLVVGSLGPVSFPVVDSPANVHPLLSKIAVENPDRIISVFVQKADHSGKAERLVAENGGDLTKDLHIINALVAELPAESALNMAFDPAIRWITLDAPVENTKKTSPKKDEPDTILPENYFLDTLRVRPLWEMGLQGQGITVAVIDSGVDREKDLQVDPYKAKPDSRVIEQLSFNSNPGQLNDASGHGTHVAGIIGGSGYRSDGLYAGIAPQVNLISLRISDDSGMAYESDAIYAMQWVLDNKDKYNIRAVNLSINSTIESSYHASPLDAAAEILWFNGVVVVASVGNKGQSDGYNTAKAAPANDPFIITVGASDERGSPDLSDDTISSFSAHSTTLDGHSKPEIIAPGTDIISILGPGDWISDHPDRVVMNGEYFRLSGTSMSAPMVTGAVALLLQDEPDLTPDQIKYRLINSAGGIGGRYPYLDIYAAVTGSSTESANTGQIASQLLWTGDDPVAWDSVAWNSVAWNSVAWNSVAWNSVAWNSVSWSSVAWKGACKRSAAWNDLARSHQDPLELESLGQVLFYSHRNKTKFY
jgi:serine protease AprX